MADTLGIIGLGHVGLPVARAFLEAGYTVYGYARRREVMDRFSKLGGILVANPADMARKTSILIILVLNDQQVIEVLTGRDGFLTTGGPGTTVIGMSTINRHTVIRMAEECSARGVSYVDCPFTGGPSRVPAGELTLIMAAPKKLVEKTRPIMSIIGKIHHVGEEIGRGQAVKHCNQLLVAVTEAATMEVLTLAGKMDLDLPQVCEIIGSGIAGSDWFRLLTKAILSNEPSPGGLGQMCKDIGIVVTTGRENKVPLYVATAAYHYFLAAEALNMERRETSDLIEVVQRVSSAAPSNPRRAEHGG
jgi:3-hydroxyisobutyrate dehydrogenase-like beta-hydroxyacid dehydrogenase